MKYNKVYLAGLNKKELLDLAKEVGEKGTGLSKLKTAELREYVFVNQPSVENSESAFNSESETPINTDMTKSSNEPIPSLKTTEMSKEKELLFGYPVLEKKVIPYTDIIRQFNVRTQKNEEAIGDIYDSIYRDGVLNPLHISADNILLEGHRRLYAVRKKSAEKNKVENVPVIVLDIPLNEVPLYQLKAGLTKSLNGAEINRAIVEYAVRNPDLNNIKISQVFSVSHTTVNTALSILRKSQDLSQDVSDGKISTRAALKVIKVADLCRKEPTEVFHEIKARVKANDDDCATNLTAKRVNCELKNLYPNGFDEISKRESSDKQPKIESKTVLIKELLKKLNAINNRDNTEVLLDGVIPKDLWDKINGVFNPPVSTPPVVIVEKGDLTTVTITDKTFENPLDCWTELQRTECDQDYLLANNITFDDEALDVADLLNKSTSFFNGVPSIELTDADIEKLVNKFNVRVVNYKFTEYEAFTEDETFTEDENTFDEIESTEDENTFDEIESAKPASEKIKLEESTEVESAFNNSNSEFVFSEKDLLSDVQFTTEDESDVDEDIEDELNELDDADYSGSFSD